MKINTTSIPYKETGFFSKIVIDYLEQAEQLQPFYNYPVSLKGIKKSITARKAFSTNRELLVTELTKQYHGISLNDKQQNHLQSLLSDNTFTITTAHQPNIFTGPLYFIYKIMHVIKLANELSEKLPDYKFVPMYYMGSEDADLEELGFINVDGQKLVWQTNQTGAVGRMKVDQTLIKLIDAIYGQIGVDKHGKELTDLFRLCYSEGKTIQRASLELINALFAEFGLLILIPDNKNLKKSFESVIKKEIEEQFSNKAVQQTINELNKYYKVQASGRALNLFYLQDNSRDRIELEDEIFKVNNTSNQFDIIEIQQDIKNNPDRFSANVILRGVFQETILPNIAFIGGGGELAYWLELKNVFKAVHVPYPLLILRNSFLIVNHYYKQIINSLKIDYTSLFKNEFELMTDWTKDNSENQLSIKNELENMAATYQQIKKKTENIDATLINHVTALETIALKKLGDLGKKILRAEKRKFKKQELRIKKIKQKLFPYNSLQERVDNFSTYYAKEGKGFLQTIYDASTGFNQEFTVVEQVAE